MVTAQVFGIPELLDSILDYSDEQTVLVSQRVNRDFRDAAVSSNKLKRKLFLLPEVPTPSVTVDGVRVNPLVATLRTDCSESAYVLRLDISDRILLPPTDTIPAYHVAQKHESWRNMHLIAGTWTGRINIRFPGLPPNWKFGSAWIENYDKTLGKVFDDEKLKEVYAAAGVERRLVDYTTGVPDGRLPLETGVQHAVRMACLLAPISARARDGFSRGHRQALREIAKVERECAERAMRDRARDAAFSCAMEDFEGKETHIRGIVMRWLA